MGRDRDRDRNRDRNRDRDRENSKTRQKLIIGRLFEMTEDIDCSKPLGDKDAK